MRVSVLALIIPTAVYAVAIDKDNVDQVNGESLVGYFKNMWLSKRDILYRYHNNHDSWDNNEGSWRDGPWREGPYGGGPYPEAPAYSIGSSPSVYQPSASIQASARASSVGGYSNSAVAFSTNAAVASPSAKPSASSSINNAPSAVASQQAPVSYSVQIENGNYVYRPVYSPSSASVNDDEYPSESFSEPDLALFPTDSPFAKHYPEFQEPEGLFAGN